MNELAADEKRSLVELTNRLHPRSLRITQPPLRPDLEALSKRPLARKPRAILFDVYGTLVVSAAGEPLSTPREQTPETNLACELLEIELANAGWSGGRQSLREEWTRRMEEAARTHRGSEQRETDVELIFSEIFPALSAAHIRRIALLFEAWGNPCAPMPGARRLLRSLVAQGFRLGLISNAQFYTPILLEALFGSSPTDLGLDPRLCEYSYHRGIAKPSTAMFLSVGRILEEARIPPEEILFIGNSSINDVAPARSLGWMTALFAGDARSFRPSEQGSPGASPDLVLARLDELLRRLPAELRL